MPGMFDKRFEVHSLHDKQVIRLPITAKNRKLFLGRNNVQGKPKSIPRQQAILHETRAGIRLSVPSEKPVVVIRADGTHVLNQDDECALEPGDVVQLLQGKPYKYRLVYEDQAKVKKERKGHKIAEAPAPEFEGTLGLMAFPSLSTGSFKFDPEQAVPIALDAVEEFLKAHPKEPIQLMLVDSVKSSVLQLFADKWKERDGDERFSTFHGNILKLGTNEGIYPQFLVDPANAYFNVVTGLNKYMHIAGAPHLLPDTLTVYEGEDPVTGSAYPVRTRKGTQLYGQGVRYVLHVIGPNMNPCWPNYLKKEDSEPDYEKGCALLKNSYQNMLTTFYEIAFKGLTVPDLTPPEPEEEQKPKEEEKEEEQEEAEPVKATKEEPPAKKRKTETKTKKKQ